MTKIPSKESLPKPILAQIVEFATRCGLKNDNGYPDTKTAGSILLDLVLNFKTRNPAAAAILFEAYPQWLDVQPEPAPHLELVPDLPPEFGDESDATVTATPDATATKKPKTTTKKKAEKKSEDDEHVDKQCQPVSITFTDTTRTVKGWRTAHIALAERALARGMESQIPASYLRDVFVAGRTNLLEGGQILNTNMNVSEHADRARFLANLLNEPVTIAIRKEDTVITETFHV